MGKIISQDWHIKKSFKYIIKFFVVKFFLLSGPSLKWLIIKILNNALFKKNSVIFYTHQSSGLTGIFATVLIILLKIKFLEKFRVPIHITSDLHWFKSLYKLKKKNSIWHSYFQKPYPIKSFKGRNIEIKSYEGKNKLLTFLTECLYPMIEYNLANLIKLSPLFKAYIKLNRKTGIYVKKEISKIINSKDVVLGVSVRRGFVVAKSKNHPIQPDLSMLKKDIKKILKSHIINKILVVCDDNRLITQLKKQFRKIVVYIDRPRLNDERYPNRSTLVMRKKELLSVQVQGNLGKKIIELSDFGRKNELYKRTREYISEIYALARCQHLLAGKSSGSAASIVINSGKYKSVKLYELGNY